MQMEITKKQTKPVFRERDLNIAAFFLCKGLKLIDLEGFRTKRFVFADSEGKAEAIRYEFLNHGVIDAHGFAAAQKQLKTLLYANGDNNEEKQKEDSSY